MQKSGLAHHVLSSCFPCREVITCAAFHSLRKKKTQQIKRYCFQMKQHAAQASEIAGAEAQANAAAAAAEEADRKRRARVLEEAAEAVQRLQQATAAQEQAAAELQALQARADAAEAAQARAEQQTQELKGRAEAAELQLQVAAAHNQETLQALQDRAEAAEADRAEAAQELQELRERADGALGAAAVRQMAISRLETLERILRRLDSSLPAQVNSHFIQLPLARSLIKQGKECIRTLQAGLVANP